MRLAATALSLLVVCSAVAVEPPKTKSALDRAAEEFKTKTGELGLRPGQTPGAKEKSSKALVWHGRVFENFRNDALDAIPHEVAQRGERNSLLRRNQFGASVSGPLVIPHLLSARHGTFFSVSYEGVREHISRTFLTTVPTLDQRHGDFSQTVDSGGLPLQIFDPLATTVNPAYDPTQAVSVTNLQYLRNQFAGYVIPVTRLDGTALAALALYPNPNANAGPYFQRNYFVNSPATDNADGMIGKVDQQVGARHRLTLDMSLSNGLLGSPRLFDTAANPGSPDQTFRYRRAELRHVFTLSPSTVNTITFGVDGRIFRSKTADGSTFPVYRIDPYVGFGTGSPSGRTARAVYTLTDGISTHRGGHYVSAVASFLARQVNAFSSDYPNGYFQFSSGITSLPGIVDTGDPFASFLLGMPDFAEKTFVPQPSYFRNSALAVSLQDRYEITKQLTVTVGLTFNRHVPRHEKNNAQSTVDPKATNPNGDVPGALVFAGVNGVPAGLRPVSYSADPSLSFAWSPFADMKTAIRGSVARSHGVLPIYSSQWGTQGFTALQSVISQNNQLSPALQLSAGLPALGYTLPNVRPDAANGAVADWLDLSAKEPVYQSASLSVERQLPFSFIVSGGAYYNGGRDLLLSGTAANPNAISPAALRFGNLLYDQNFAATLRPYPNYTSLDLSSLYPIGRYQRDAAFLRAEKRLSNGLSVTAYYEYGKQFDDYSGPYGIQDMFNRRNDWSQTSSVPHQYVQLSYTYDLPVLHSEGWSKWLTNNWSIGGRIYLDNGSPLALHPQFNNTGGVISGLMVDTVPGVSPLATQQSANMWFNPAAFVQPADFTLGDGPRTIGSVLSPGVHNFDSTLVKRFEAGKDSTLEFTATAINVFNHADWNYPDTAIGSLAAPNTDAGHIIGSHGGRVIQLGLSYNF